MTDPSPAQPPLPPGPLKALDATQPSDDTHVPAAPVPLSLAAPEMTRTVLALIALMGLIVGSLWVLRPFIPALIWATTIVIATWPLMTAAQRLLWGRRGLAVTAMIAAQLLLFFAPLTLAIATVVDNVDTTIAWIRAAATWRPGEPPTWLGRIPVIGQRALDAWREFRANGAGPLLTQVMPYVGSFAGTLVKEAGALGAILLQFLMTVAISGILYATGETAGSAVMRFSRRLAGRRGENTALLAAASIRGVALGVIVTAVAQSVLGGVGLAVAGVPAAALLTAVMFLLAIAQIGVIPVLLPAVVWLYWTGDTTWGTLLLVWTGFVGTFDNFLRPWLIRKGADLPLLLIFAGVIGGLVAFGLVGIFIGPVVLAVTYTLLGAWMAERPVRSTATPDA